VKQSVFPDSASEAFLAGLIVQKNKRIHPATEHKALVEVQA
jgi:hypothetical protein